MFTRLIYAAPWAIATVMSLLVFYYWTEQQYLNNRIEAVSSENTRIIEQRNSVISVNNAMHNTVMQLQNQLEESHKLDALLNSISNTMDAKLSVAVKEIERVTDDNEQTSTLCDYSFSSDVNQRMLDVYARPADSVQE